MNISQGGLGLFISGQKHPRQEFTVVISAPGLEPTPIPCTIVWRIESEKGGLFGARFTTPDSQDLKLILSYIESGLSSKKFGYAQERRKLQYFEQFIDSLKQNNIHHVPKIFDGPAMPQTRMNGAVALSFGSNNVLGMSTDTTVINAAQSALHQYGTTCGGSRLVSGNLSLQVELERSLSKFLRTESALVFMTGYMANVGIIQSLSNTFLVNGSIPKDTVIFCDRENHASIMTGCRLAETVNKCRVRYYRHCDMGDLEQLLKKNSGYRKIIISEGVFSMLGDVAPVKEIQNLSEQYGAISYIDDAHGIGILGSSGRGSCEKDGDVHPDILVGTMSKAFGAVGGFVAASKKLIDYFRLQTSTFIFTSALPPATAAGIITAISEIDRRPELRERLWENVTLMRSLLKDAGLRIISDDSHVIPIFVGEDSVAQAFSDHLATLGIYCPAMRWPARPKNKAIMRCMVSASHSEEEIRRAAAAFSETARQVRLVD